MREELWHQYQGGKSWSGGSDGWWDGGYHDLIDDLGEVLTDVRVGDYAGSLLWLLRDGDRFGYLSIGYGSCSGCDALEGCDTLAELRELHDELAGYVRWGSRSETLAFLRDHDWEGDWSYQEDKEAVSDFIAQATAALS